MLKGCGAEPYLTKLLEPLGYRYYLLSPNGPERMTTITGHPEYLNYLFTSSDFNVKECALR